MTYVGRSSGKFVKFAVEDAQDVRDAMLPNHRLRTGIERPQVDAWQNHVGTSHW